MKTNISRNTTATEDMRRLKSQTYLLEFGTDGTLYSVSFLGKIPPENIKRILESVQNCLYADMADRILDYLKQHHLAYKNFVAGEMPLDYGTAKNHTDILLHSASCNRIDKQIGGADIYYGIMDCQQWKNGNCCEGCYLAVKRIFSEQKALYQYRIAGQMFCYDGMSTEEESCFAIRASDNSRSVYDMDTVRDRAVIPTFGCVDMIGLLLNIDNIKTTGTSKKIVMKL